MGNESVDVFNFMALRGCERLDPSASRVRFVRDDFYHWEGFGGPSVPAPEDRMATGVHDVDLFSPGSLSPIGRELFSAVLAGQSVPSIVRLIETQLVTGLIY